MDYIANSRQNLPRIRNKQIDWMNSYIFEIVGNDFKNLHEDSIAGLSQSFDDGSRFNNKKMNGARNKMSISGHIRFKSASGTTLLRVTRHGREILVKTGITNAASLLPLTDEDLMAEVPVRELEIERETLLEKLRERNFQKRYGLYTRLWDQFTAEQRRRNQIRENEERMSMSP